MDFIAGWSWLGFVIYNEIPLFSPLFCSAFIKDSPQMKSIRQIMAKWQLLQKWIYTISIFCDIDQTVNYDVWFSKSVDVCRCVV